MVLGNNLQGQELPAIPDYPLEQGISAPYAGFAGDRLIVAGGCNFPDRPAAEGGRKCFYDTVYYIDVSEAEPVWRPLAKLPVPAAYGAAVADDRGLVCIGGQNESGSLSEVIRIGFDGRITRLPALPVTIDNGGAALCGTTVYVTGGNQPDGGKALYALDLADPVAWQRLADYPGQRRIQPVVLSHSGRLFLAGGYDFDAASKSCTLASDLLAYDIATGTWSRCCRLVAGRDGTRRCLVGGSGVVVHGSLILTGGVNYGIFKEAMEGRGPSDYMRKPVEWYRFNDDLLICNPTTGDWQEIYDVTGMARAGGVLLVHDDVLYMVCGELKPGIRSARITTYKLKERQNQ